MAARIDSGFLPPNHAAMSKPETVWRINSYSAMVSSISISFRTSELAAKKRKPNGHDPTTQLEVNKR
jgi:hypothetical protein